ncbi:hypothetical protein ACO0RG_001554 [Hanseniaspora osmophila]
MSDQKIQQFVEAQRLPAKTLYQYKLYHLKYVAWYKKVYHGTTSGEVDDNGVTNKAVDNKAVDNKAVDNKAVDNKAVDNKAVDYANVDIDAYKICLFLIHCLKDTLNIDAIMETIVPALEFLYKLATLATGDQDTIAHVLAAKNVPQGAVINAFVSYLRLLDALETQKNDKFAEPSLLEKLCINFYNDSTGNLGAIKSSLFKTSLDKLKLVVDFQLQYYGNIPYNKRELIKISDLRLMEHKDTCPIGFSDLVMEIQVKEPTRKLTTVVVPSVPTNVFVCGLTTLSCFMFLRVYGSNNYQGDLKGFMEAITNETETTNTKSRTVKSRLSFPLIKGRFLNKSISKETMSQYYQVGFPYLKEPYKKNNFFDKKASAATNTQSVVRSAPKIVFNGFDDLEPVPAHIKSVSPAPQGSLHNQQLQKKTNLTTARFWNVQSFEQNSSNTHRQDMAQIVQYVASECRARSSTKDELEFVASVWEKIPAELHDPLFAEFKQIAKETNDQVEFQFWDTMGKHVLWILPFLYKFFPSFDIFLSNNGMFTRQNYVQYYLNVWNRYATDPVGQKLWNKYVAMLDSLMENHTSASELHGGMNAPWEGTGKNSTTPLSTTSTGMTTREVEKLVESMLSKRLQSGITVKQEDNENSLNRNRANRYIHEKEEKEEEEEEEDEEEEEEDEDDDEQQLQQLIKLLISKEFAVLKKDLKKELRDELVADLRSHAPQQNNSQENKLSSELLSDLKKEILSEVRESVITEIKKQVAQDIAEGLAQDLKREIKYELNQELASFLKPSSTTTKLAKPLDKETEYEQMQKRVSSLPAKRKISAEKEKDHTKHVKEQSTTTKSNFTLNPNEQLPIADVICEWYSPDPQQNNMSISSMNKKYNTLWRATDPNKHLYKLRKPVIEAYLKTFSLLHQRSHGSKSEVDLKLETLQLLDGFCSTKFGGDMVAFSSYLKSSLKDCKTNKLSFEV